MNFIKAVQNPKNKIIPPNKKGFSLDDWEKGFNKFSERSADDLNFFNAGKIFNEIFERIRSLLSELDSSIPKMRNEKIIRLLFSMSNLQLISVFDQLFSQPLTNINTDIPQKFKNPFGEFEAPPQDVLDTLVDSIEKAVRRRVDKISQKNCSDDPIEVFQFLKIESMLSELYYAIEYYWQGIMWGSYEVLETNNKVIIRQKKEADNIKYLLSQNRKMKFNSLPRHEVEKIQINNEYILGYLKGKITIKKAGNLSQFDLSVYKNMIVHSFYILEKYPRELVIEKILDKKFSVLDILLVFQQITIFSRQIINEIRNNLVGVEEITDIDLMLSYSPSFKIDRLCQKLSLVTKIQFGTVKEIILLLSFSSKKSNLWSYPLLKLNKNYISILISATYSPNFNRIIEYWLRDLQSEILKKKGNKFENILVEKLNKNLASNAVFKGFKQPKTITITVNGFEEEIDCIFSFGKNIVVCEAKCIFSTDSEISRHNAKKSLLKGATQANRKAEFVKQNLEAVFKELKWEFDTSINFKIIPVLINSNGLYVGHSFEGVPVVDDIILSSYFRQGTFPLISVSSTKHVAWFDLYSNLEEAENQFEKYLSRPPQICLDNDFFEYVYKPINQILGLNREIEIQTLALKNYTVKDVLDKTYLFQLVTVNDIEHYISNVDIII